MDYQAFLERHRAELERNSHFEVLFVQDVLSRVTELQFELLSTQTKFVDDRGGSRYIDFTYAEGGRVRLALEVDGYNKDGASPGMSREQFVDWQRRERAIVRQGWRLLRFANTEVLQNPHDCARSISLTLKVLRAEEIELERAKEAERANAQITDLQQQLRDAEYREISVRNEMHILAESLAASRTALEAITTDLREAQSNRQPEKVRELEAQLNQERANIAALNSRHETQSAELVRITHELESLASGSSGLDPTTLKDLIELREKQEASIHEFEAKLNEEIEARLHAEKSARKEANARRIAETQRAVARQSQVKTEKEIANMKAMLAGLVLIAVAAFGTVLLLAWSPWEESEPDMSASFVPTVRPGKSPSPSTQPMALTLQSLSSPVVAGDNAALRLTVVPNAVCTLSYTTPSGTISNADGIGKETADSHGNIYWNWKIGSGTRAGKGTVEVICDANGSHGKGSWPFEIRRQ